MAKYSSRRSQTIFIRHHGREQRSIYFRVNPQAIRVQQGNKGSVVDTLGGYFREVLYAEDPQHNGLMLPDLTIECDTGVGYRDELKKFEWVWRQHGDRKADGTPADTYLMDFADGDTEWFDGAVGSNGAGAARMTTHQHNSRGRDLVPQAAAANIHGAAYTLRGLLSRPMRTALGQANGGSRYTPRIFKIELLNFAWDETVSDPFRIRFNFRCKILRDMLWRVEQRDRTGRTMFSLAQAQGDWTDKQVAAFGDGGTGSLAGTGSQEFPLNVAAQSAMVQASNASLPSLMGTPISEALDSVLSLSGLGRNQTARKVLELGRSVFGVNQPTYPTGTQSDLTNLNASLGDIIRNLPAIVPVGNQTRLQSPGWQPPPSSPLSELVDFGLPDLSFFQGLVEQATGGAENDEPTESTAYPNTRSGEIWL